MSVKINEENPLPHEKRAQVSLFQALEYVKKGNASEARRVGEGWEGSESLEKAKLKQAAGVK